MGCANLSAALPITCAAELRPGGIKKKVWLANLSDISAYTIASNVISAITMSGATTFYAYEGKTDKHSTGAELVVGEAVNSFKQIVNLVLFTSTSAEDAIVEALCNAVDLVVIAETNDQQFEVYGLDVVAGAAGSPAGGLKCESATKGSGVTVNERQPWTLTLSGNLRNVERKFFTTDYATTKAAVIALE